MNIFISELNAENHQYDCVKQLSSANHGSVRALKIANYMLKTMRIGDLGADEGAEIVLEEHVR